MMNAPEAKRRYEEKIKICGKDPYLISTTPMDVPLNVNFAAIYNYMIVEPNPFTGAAKDSAKGMEANLWFQQGWVKHVSGRKLADVYVVHGKVLHSFSLRERPLNPWIIIDHKGRILSAHCNCAIGLLETCSHVGATLFALDDIRQKFLDKKISVTDLPAYWNKPPTNVQGNLYKKVKDISFGGKIKRFWEPVVQPTQDRYAELFRRIQDKGVHVAAMYSFCGVGSFICTTCKEAAEFQNEYREYDLRNLFDRSYRTRSKPELDALVRSTYNDMANDVAKLQSISEITTSQDQNQHWAVFRTGRITASVLRESCHTNITNPSLTLIRKICYNQEGSLQTSSMRYGKTNELRAYEQLFNAVAHCHKNPVKQQCGLIICPEYPFLGASPDGMIQCDCHGKITVEIKCPYSGKNNDDFTDALLKMSDPYISIDGGIRLNPNHKYFHQALMQVHLADANFGYFYIWSPKKQYLFKIERNDAFWTSCRDKASLFFQQLVLPELLYKAYTEPM